MPAPVIAGFCNYLSATQQLNISVWEGEVPRSNVDGTPVVISGTIPACVVEMTESGLDRKWTQADPYADSGPLVFMIWAATREEAQTLLNQLEALLVDSSNWPNIALPGGPIDNPFYVVEVIWQNWTVVQEIGLRTQDSEYIYRAQATCKVTIHGAIVTRSV